MFEIGCLKTEKKEKSFSLVYNVDFLFYNLHYSLTNLIIQNS